MHAHAGGIFQIIMHVKWNVQFFLHCTTTSTSTSQKQLTHFDLPQHCMIVLLPVKNSRLFLTDLYIRFDNIWPVRAVYTGMYFEILTDFDPCNCKKL